MKPLILSAFLFAASGAFALPVIGTWHCTASDENVRTESKVRFHDDGSYRETGFIRIDDEGNILSYRVEASGKWQFDGNTLTQTQTEFGRPARHHSRKTQAWLKQSPENREMEQAIFDYLKRNAKQTGSTVYRLDDSGNLHTEDGSYRSSCAKLK